MANGETPISGAFQSGLEATLHSITQEAEGILLFEFRPRRGHSFPAFQAGAHIDLHLSNGLNRSYSIVNPQTDRDRYVIAVKNEISGRGGSRYIHHELRVGDSIKIGEPRNNFPLQEGSSHSVFIAGGIGITPLYSMIQRLEQLQRPWELHYAAADQTQAAFVAQLRSLRPKTHFYFKTERSSRGALDVTRIVSDSPNGTDFYCCGPTRMLLDFETATASIQPDHVHAEFFTARDKPAVEGGFKVILQRSGQEFIVQPGETILDTLLKFDVDIPYSCMEGVCGSCQVGVIEGIPDHRDLILSKEERAMNDKMLVCCSGSKSPKLILDL
jgi:tetrachlorobenzoquinone reductase